MNVAQSIDQINMHFQYCQVSCAIHARIMGIGQFKHLTSNTHATFILKINSLVIAYLVTKVQDKY